MMDKMKLLHVLKENMQFLALKLRKTPEIMDKNFTINSGAWANESGFCVAYLSCSRSPHEETIDLTIDIVLNENILFLESGIYLSDGKLIEDFGSVNISAEKLDEAQSDLEEYFTQMALKEFVNYSNFLLQQKDEPD